MKHLIFGGLDVTPIGLAILVVGAFYAGVRVGEVLHLRSAVADRDDPMLAAFEARFRSRAALPARRLRVLPTRERGVSV